MIEDKLEIILITYNRAKDLNNTLKMLYESPFKKCKITVLDNNSNDETPEVCTKYQELFKDMNTLRHDMNMGSSPNYLRAVEIAKMPYTWVLCDDDPLDFSNCLDVIDAIESDNYDLILVGSETQLDWERGLKTTSRELIEKGAHYYNNLSFIPCTIFRTELFDAYCLYRGYFHVPDIYPHFEFINKSVENDFSVYVSKQKIVQWGNDNLPGFSQLNILQGWLNACTTIKDKKIRKKSLYGPANFTGFIEGILSSIVFEKIRENGKSSSEILMPFISSFVLGFGFSKEQLILPLIVSASLVPSSIFKSSLKTYMYFKYDRKGKEVPEKTMSYLFDETRFKRLH